MIGEMTKRATLQNPTETKKPSGGTEVSYTTLATVWCSLKPIGEHTSREGLQTNQLAGFKCVLRYSLSLRAGLTKDTRVTVDGVQYRIEGMESDRKYITLKLSGVKNGI